MKISHIVHLGIAVKSIEEALPYYENVLGPNVFIMLCSSLPYPIMTPQIDDIIKDAPYSFKSNKMVREFLTKAKENMQLIEEHQRMQQNVGSKK